METQKILTPLFFVLILLTAALAVLPVFAAPITITPAKTEYKSGETLNVTGVATPNTDITIQLFDSTGKRVAITQVTADAEGAYSAANLWIFTKDDPSGTWTVKAYDAAAAEWAEATFTVTVDVTAPTLTITIEPTKAVYKEETITIVVSSNEELKTAPTVTVTQAGASSVTVTMTETAPLKWSGTYTIVKGFDGTATVEATGEDLAGNVGTAKATFTVEVVPAWEKSIAELQKKISALETKISSLESKVTTLESKIKSLESKLTATSGEIGTLKSKVDSLSAEVATLSGISTIAYVAIVLGIIGIVVGIIAIVKKPKPPTPS